jgi:hypothetical protein
VDRFVKRENIEHYRRLREARSPAVRRKILGSLAEERAQFKLEFRQRSSEDTCLLEHGHDEPTATVSGQTVAPNR